MVIRTRLSKQKIEPKHVADMTIGQGASAHETTKAFKCFYPRTFRCYHRILRIRGTHQLKG